MKPQIGSPLEVLRLFSLSFRAQTNANGQPTSEAIRDVGGQTKRVLIARFPIILTDPARQSALGSGLNWGGGVGKEIEIGARLYWRLWKPVPRGANT